MEINSVAILGAGAVGSYMIWGLSSKKDLRLGVIGEGKRAKRLKQGCFINDQMYYPEVWSSQEAHNVDLLIVSLKYGALKPALDSIKTIVGKNTTVMSLMKVASRKDNGYRFDPETTIGIIFGEKQAPFQSERVQMIENLFENTGLHYRTSEFIQEEIWSKFRLNVCNNLPQAILGVGVGCYQDSKHMKFIQEGLQQELEAIACAKGIDLSKVSSSSTRGSAVPAWAHYSTLQDLDAKRPTEIDMFSGTLIKMGKDLGIPTPYNKYTYHLIKALEEKNEGLFDYDQNDSRETCAK